MGRATASDGNRGLFVVLGDQLFAPAHLRPFADWVVFMAETRELCTRVRHHQQKLTLVLSAMREHASVLRRRGFEVAYDSLDDDPDGGYEEKLKRQLDARGIRTVASFEVEDRFMEDRLAHFAERHRLRYRIVPSPMFVAGRADLETCLRIGKRPSMAAFYRRRRQASGILMGRDGRPAGGRWSFDADNRKRLPPDLVLPALPRVRHSPVVASVQRLVRREFGGHPGDAETFWLPATRSQWLAWLSDFLEYRFRHFGDYEDALTSRSDAVFHSVLSPALNLGLLTPAEVLDRALRHAERERTPLNSVEGFVRQILGWREFVRGIYRTFGDQQEASNHFGHGRRLTPHWYEARTGIEPLDRVIDKTRRLGWAHHIERLMVVGNLMVLCEIEPRDAHRWFMEMFVDAADWVMGPNVYGMALYSDGGIFATKPYVCASSYLMRMGDYPRGAWCDVVDGLYWRFIARHQSLLVRNPRMGVVARAVDRLSAARRERIFAAAEAFLATRTAAP